MALLVPSPEISLLAGRANPARGIRRIRSRYVGLSVHSGVRDLPKKVLKLRGDDYADNMSWLYGQVKLSETAPFSSSKAKEEEKKKREYYVNTGYAIRTLREEFPELFHRELTFDIYRFTLLLYLVFNLSVLVVILDIIFYLIAYLPTIFGLIYCFQANL